MGLLYWGILKHDMLSRRRRTRALGLGASVRHFNEQAVPGLGGLRFGKQLLWALLGIQVAQECRQKNIKVTNIEVANAIEAMSCLMVLREKNDNSSGRIAGRNKLREPVERGTSISFAEARKAAFYTSQPMRMGTVQPLHALGFVESESMRFNTYTLSSSGEALLAAACKAYRPLHKSVSSALVDWVCGQKNPWGTPRAAQSP